MLLSKYANISMEYTDWVTPPQLDTLMELLNKHNEEVRGATNSQHSNNLMDNPDMIG